MSFTFGHTHSGIVGTKSPPPRVWMDAWMDAWIDGCMDARMDAWIDRCMDGWMYMYVYLV